MSGSILRFVSLGLWSDATSIERLCGARSKIKVLQVLMISTLSPSNLLTCDTSHANY